MTLFVHLIQSTHFTLGSEVNALHLYPQVREEREMDECLVDIKEDREQELDNNDTENTEKYICT